jgi:hypothetical protein
VRKKLPFEQVAQFSDDRARVGDLGTGHGDMVAEFEEVAFKLKPMEISMPVRTRFGYHIIQVLEHFSKTDSTDERVHARRHGTGEGYACGRGPAFGRSRSGIRSSPRGPTSPRARGSSRPTPRRAIRGACWEALRCPRCRRISASL